MSHHSIIELNHDHAHEWYGPEFGKALHNILARRYLGNISRHILQKYGIKILSQHHSEVKHKLVLIDDEDNI